MADPDRRPADFVQSLERGLAIIRTLAAREPQTLTDVARAAGVSRAAARRFLITLRDLGYVTEDGGRFALTPRVLELGYAYLSSLTLPEVAQPHLERLVARVQESSSVSILDGSDVVYVARVPTRRIMTVAINVGTRFPAYATSMGRVLLAELDQSNLRRALGAGKLHRYTDATTTSRAKLSVELKQVRRQGWALVDQELEVGLRSIAAPIRDRAGEVTAALNVSTHVSRATIPTLKKELLPPLLEAAAGIEADLRANQVVNAV